MHATYSFLINTTATTPEALAADAEAAFDAYVEEHCDENNWSQAMVAINRDGLLAPLCPAEDWRGRDGTQSEYVVIPAAKRFDAARHLAISCIAHDLELKGLRFFGIGEPTAAEKAAQDWLENASVEDIDKAIREEMPRRLAALWAAVDTERAFNDDRTGFYMVNKLSGIFGRYLSGRQYHPLLPFVEATTPYDSVRAMDLTTEYDENNSAIVLVDIHT